MEVLKGWPTKGRIIFLLILISFSTTAFLHTKQEHMAVADDLIFTLDPKYSSDYLAWEIDEGAVSWQIEILEKEDPESEVSGYLTVLQFEQTKNYYQVDDLFRDKPNIIIRVTAKNAEGQDINVGNWDLGLCPPPGCAGWTDVCTWKCNGPDYAFEINLIENNAGERKLQLDHTEQSPGVPYYQFVKQSDWNNFIMNAGPCYPFILNPDWVQNNRVPFPNISPGQGFFDIAGNQLAGNLYGIPKGLCAFGPPRTTDPLIFDDNNCMGSIDFIINTFNNQETLPSYFGPELDCIPTPQPNIGIGTDDPPMDPPPIVPDEIAVTFVWYFCPGGFCPTERCCAPIIGPGEPFDDLFDQFTTYDPDYGNYVAPEPPIDDFNVEEFSEFRIQRLDQLQDPVIINADDIYLGNGTIAYPDLSYLENGLYKIVVVFDNGQQDQLFFEYSGNTGSSSAPATQAEQLEVTIYPVPVSANQFSIDLTANDDLDFTYRLTTLAGATLYEEAFSLAKDQTMTIPVSLQDTPEPLTILVNSFYFNDGSTKVLQIIKQ